MITSSLLGVCLFFLLSEHAAAHFTINYPPPLGDNSENEGNAPCGGFVSSPSFTTTNFHVDGDAIALVTLHPQANILFRGSLDMTASGNWTNLFLVVGQYGLGAFCEPSLISPASWAGSSGLIQVIENSVDGILYQCAAVKFITGKAPSVPSVCTNGTGVSVSFTSDPSLPGDALTSASSVASATVSFSSSAMSTPKASSAAASHVNLGVLLRACLATLLLIT